MMYIVPTLGGQPDPAAAGSLLERGGQRRGRLHKNVCGIPQSSFLFPRAALVLLLSPSFLRVCCFRGFFYNTFNLLCSSARSPQPLSYVFFCLVFHTIHVCVPVFVYKLCVSFSAVECPIQVPASYSLLPSRFLSVLRLFPHTQRFLRAALIFAAARGHYQLIDYFDCYLIPPLGRARRICASVVSRSLSLVHSEALSLLCAVAGSQT